MRGSSESQSLPEQENHMERPLGTSDFRHLSTREDQEVVQLVEFFNEKLPYPKAGIPQLDRNKQFFSKTSQAPFLAEKKKPAFLVHSDSLPLFNVEAHFVYTVNIEMGEGGGGNIKSGGGIIHELNGKVSFRELSQPTFSLI